VRAGRLRVVELYCGIGGLAAALEPAADAAEVVAAVDVNTLATGVYARSFPGHPVVAAAVESIPAERFRQWDADLWWMSPPCQPFTRRGKGRDLDDPRTAGFLAVLERIADVRPRYLALENVPPFEGSRTHGRLLCTLEEAGYGSIVETVLCPTELGVPNRRRRYYLVAGLTPLAPLPRPLPAPHPHPLSHPLPSHPGEGRHRPPPASRSRPERAKRAGFPLSRGAGAGGRGGQGVRDWEGGLTLRGYLDDDPAPKLDVDPDLVARYDGALDVVGADDPGAVTACFTSAYGRSPVRSGSYLARGSGVRRFSPAEVLRLLGFPASFRLGSETGELSLGNAWRLAGNSLSVAAVRQVLAAIPDLPGNRVLRTDD